MLQELPQPRMVPGPDWRTTAVGTTWPAARGLRYQDRRRRGCGWRAICTLLRKCRVAVIGRALRGRRRSKCVRSCSGRVLPCPRSCSCLRLEETCHLRAADVFLPPADFLKPCIQCILAIFKLVRAEVTHHCFGGQIKGQVRTKAALQEVVERGKLRKTLANQIVLTVATNAHVENGMLPTAEQRDARPEKAHALLQDAAIIGL